MTVGKLMAASVAVATLCSILWPLELSLEHLASAGSRVQLLPGDVGWVLDALKNLVAFVPLGAVLGRLRPARVAALAMLLSAGAEALQLFEPYRFISTTDVAFNTLGALFGRWLMAVAPPVLGRLRGSGMGVRLFTTAASVTLTLAAVWGLRVGMHPSGWNPDYVLARNSSALGLVPWCGTLDSLEVRAGEELWTLASLPWTRQVMERGRCRGEPWWIGPAPPGLARAVQAHRSVALRLAATPTRDQIGPARILTWADTRDGRRRNVLIAQESDSLVVYVRRGLGGEEGRRPFYVLPGVFERGTTARVILEITQEQTIIRTDAGTIVHRHDPAQDWRHLIRGRSRYAPGGSSGAVAFWSLVSVPAMAVAGAAGGATGLAGAALWLGGAAILLLAGGIQVTGGDPAPAAVAWLVVTMVGLAAATLATRAPPGTHRTADGLGHTPSGGH